MIHVVNKHWHKPLPGIRDVYVDRRTVLGNPYTHLPHRQTLAKYVVESREKAIECYKLWLNLKLDDKHSDQFELFHRIVGYAQQGDINLVCWCAPKPCHADYIKQLIENLIIPITQ